MQGEEINESMENDLMIPFLKYNENKKIETKQLL